MTPSFKKGQAVWEFFAYSETSGDWGYRLLTITSWGKKQATAKYQKNDKMIESRIYVTSVNLENHYGNHYFPVAEGFNPHLKAEELAKKAVALEIAFIEEHRMGAQVAYDRGSQLKRIAQLQALTPKAISF